MGKAKCGNCEYEYSFFTIVTIMNNHNPGYSVECGGCHGVKKVEGVKVWASMIASLIIVAVAWVLFSRLYVGVVTDEAKVFMLSVVNLFASSFVGIYAYHSLISKVVMKSENT